MSGLNIYSNFKVKCPSKDAKLDGLSEKEWLVAVWKLTTETITSKQCEQLQESEMLKGASRQFESGSFVGLLSTYIIN